MMSDLHSNRIMIYTILNQDVMPHGRFFRVYIVSSTVASVIGTFLPEGMNILKSSMKLYKAHKIQNTFYVCATVMHNTFTKGTYAADQKENDRPKCNISKWSFFLHISFLQVEKVVEMI